MTVKQGANAFIIYSIICCNSADEQDGRESRDGLMALMPSSKPSYWPGEGLSSARCVRSVVLLLPGQWPFAHSLSGVTVNDVETGIQYGKYSIVSNTV